MIPWTSYSIETQERVMAALAARTVIYTSTDYPPTPRCKEWVQ
jgi:hypothetical protein